MTRYVLRCDQAHKFEAWFHSQADAEQSLTPGRVSCPVCELAADTGTTAARATNAHVRLAHQ